MAAALSRWRWQARTAADGLGWTGLAGLALLVLAAAWWLAIEPTLSHQLAEAEADNRRLGAELAARRREGAAAETPAAQWQRFRAHFVEEAGIPLALRSLLRVAAQESVAVDEAEFRFVDGPAEPLARYHIELPVRTEYRTLRRFVAELRKAVPGLAIEEVVLRRALLAPADAAASAVPAAVSAPAQAVAGQVDARLRLVLFVAKED